MLVNLAFATASYNMVPVSIVCNAHIYESTFRYGGLISNATLFDACKSLETA